MDGSIVLRGGQRKRLLALYRADPDPHVRLRAHLVLLLADGRTWALIAAVLFCSTATITRWKRRFEGGGVDALRDDRRGRPEAISGPAGGVWRATVIRWATKLTPSFFGLARSRWCCSALVLVLVEAYHVRVSRETVRRWLHREGLVWRRPRPVLGLKDPRRAEKLRHLRALLLHLPGDEVAVFQDEVDVNTNPKIGCAWMYRGRQAEVVTPGTNAKRYIAGSLNWRTGKLVATPGGRRDAALFLAHLDALRSAYRCYRVIHVVLDNAKFHTASCKLVRRYLEKWGERVVVHYLPKYAPDTNPIERVWWHLHDEVTRNHRCPDIDSLVDRVFQWLEQKGTFAIEGNLYPKARAA